MHKFFTPKELINGDVAKILGDDVKHIYKVLRIAEGEKVVLNNCEGLEYLAKVTDVNKQEVSLEIIEKLDLNNESEIKELAVIIIDQEKPVCSFAKCNSLTDCNNNPPMINDNLVYAWGEYKLNFQNDVERVFLKMSCTNTYYKEENDELNDYTVALSDVQIDYEVTGVTNPSQVISTELLDAPVICGAVFCTKTYNYMIGVDITKADTYSDRVQVVLKKGAVKDLAFNINNSASSFMIIKNY